MWTQVNLRVFVPGKHEFCGWRNLALYFDEKMPQADIKQSVWNTLKYTDVKKCKVVSVEYIEPFEPDTSVFIVNRKGEFV